MPAAYANRMSTGKRTAVALISLGSIFGVTGGILLISGAAMNTATTSGSDVLDRRNLQRNLYTSGGVIGGAGIVMLLVGIAYQSSYP